MRTWDAEGVISPKSVGHAETLLPLLNVTIFSEEDIGLDPDLEAHYVSLAASSWSLTRAAKGCTVYQRGQPPLHIPAHSVALYDATGAGRRFCRSIFAHVEAYRKRPTGCRSRYAAGVVFCDMRRVRQYPDGGRNRGVWLKDLSNCSTPARDPLPHSLRELGVRGFTGRSMPRQKVKNWAAGAIPPTWGTRRRGLSARSAGAIRTGHARALFGRECLMGR